MSTPWAKCCIAGCGGDIVGPALRVYEPSKPGDVFPACVGFAHPVCVWLHDEANENSVGLAEWKRIFFGERTFPRGK